MKEWKPIPNFSKYDAHPMGYIRTHNWKGSGKTRVMKPAPNKDGYLCTVLINDQGKYCPVKVHRIIAKTFLQDPKKETVNHKNGIKTDNRVVNLEWMTRSENIRHSFKTGLQKPKHGELNGCSKVNASQVLKIREIANEKGRFYGRKELALKYNVTEDAIKRIVNRKTWKHL